MTEEKGKPGDIVTAKVIPHNVYKLTPTFTMEKKDLESYRAQVFQTIKVARMSLMSDGRVIEWLDEEIAKFPPTDEEKKAKLDKKIKDLEDQRKGKA